jgi:hypothetical protein
VPAGAYKLGWQYLRPNCRLARGVETIEVENADRGHQSLEIDVVVPAGRPGATWYLPVTFFAKDPVAPDLQVKDGEGRAVPIPTKRENMALTDQALRRLAAAGELGHLNDEDAAFALARDIVYALPAEARVFRIVFLREALGGNQLFADLLEELEDQFLLWVPVSGAPGERVRVVVERERVREVDPVLYQGITQEALLLDTAIGQVPVELEVPGPGLRSLRLDLRTAFERLFVGLGVVPIEFSQWTTGPRRFASYHLRVLAPPGFVVRGLQASEVETRLDGDGNEERSAERLEPVPGELTIQGTNTNRAHVHAAREENPSPLVLNAIFGFRYGFNTLWVLAVVLTAGLLWAFHQHGASLPSSRLELAGNVLLVAPAAAAAWAIATTGGDAMRTALSGARLLLLGSAVLSVAAATSLAGFSPFGWSDDTAIEVYASASYFIAAVISAGFVSATRAAWLFYRRILTNRGANLIALASLGFLATVVLAVAAVLNLADDWSRAVGVVLFALALGKAAVAANRSSVGLYESNRDFPVLGTIAAAVSVVGAGFFLGFYENLVEIEVARDVALLFESSLALACLRSWQLDHEV